MKIGGNQGGGGDFPKVEPGRYVAVCAAIYDIGVQVNEYQGETSKKAQIAIVWELEAQDPNGNPFTMVDALTASMHKKATMFAAASALLDRPMVEYEEIDTAELIGKSAMITVGTTSTGNPKIERRDALQDASRGLTIQGSYAGGDDIHGLVAWHMRKAVPGTVPGDQGLMDPPLDAAPSSEAAAVDTSANAGDPSFDDIPF